VWLPCSPGVPANDGNVILFVLPPSAFDASASIPVVDGLIYSSSNGQDGRCSFFPCLCNIIPGKTLPREKNGYQIFDPWSCSLLQTPPPNPHPDLDHPPTWYRADCIFFPGPHCVFAIAAFITEKSR